MIAIAVMTGDPIGGGDDIDASLKHSLVEIEVGEHAVKRQAVGGGGDDLVDGPRRSNSDRIDADDFAGVPSYLLRRIAVQANEFKVGTPSDPLDHL